MTNVESFTEAVKPEVHDEIILRQHLAYLREIDPEAYDAIIRWAHELKAPDGDMIRFLQGHKWLEKDPKGDLTVRRDVKSLLDNQVISEMNIQKLGLPEAGPVPISA